MSDDQIQQGTAVPMEKVLEKLKSRIADQVVQIAMLESYIDSLQEPRSAPQPMRESPIQPARESFREVNKIEED